MESPRQPPPDATFLRIYDEGSTTNELAGVGCGLVALLTFACAISAAFDHAYGSCFGYSLAGWFLCLGTYRFYRGFSRKLVHWLSVTPDAVSWVAYNMNARGELVCKSERVAMADIVALELEYPLRTGATSHVVTRAARFAMPRHLLRDKKDTDALAAAILQISPGVSVTRDY